MGSLRRLLVGGAEVASQTDQQPPHRELTTSAGFVGLLNSAAKSQMVVKATEVLKSISQAQMFKSKECLFCMQVACRDM